MDVLGKGTLGVYCQNKTKLFRTKQRRTQERARHLQEIHNHRLVGVFVHQGRHSIEGSVAVSNVRTIGAGESHSSRADQ